MSETTTTNPQGKGIPQTSPMNLTLVSTPTTTATGEVYTMRLQDLPANSPPLQPPAGSTPVVAANSSLTYRLNGTLPDGTPVNIELNGAGVLMYKTP